MQDGTLQNSVKLAKDGYIAVTLVGNQTQQTIEDSALQCQRLADQLRTEGKPVLGLIDFTHEDKFSTGANKATLDAMGSINYDRVAAFGKSRVLAEVTELIIQALGKTDRTKVFATREEALAWLMMRDPVHGYGIR